MNHRTFDLHDPNDVERVHKIHRRYMEDGMTLETIGASLGVGHATLRRAFLALDLPLKINRRVTKEEVKALQAKLGAPIDYLAARYGMHENTIRQWMKARPANKKYQGIHAKHWWRAIASACDNDPNEFFEVLTTHPHCLRPHLVPAIYHRRVKPAEPLLWQLEMDEPADDVDGAFLATLSGTTEPDTSAYPSMFLGIGSKVKPVRWDDESLTDDLKELSGNTGESDADLASVAEDLGLSLEDFMAKK